MARSDLLALTDDGLIQLSNAGIVKRGLKEQAAGAGPTLDEAPDGAISATFTDGTVTRLGAGQALADASCTCPSSGLCRHRIALAISYRATGVTEAGEAEPQADWDPAGIDNEAFEAALGPAAKSELSRLLGARIDVRLERGRTPSARLPMATVRFLVPDDVSYARCDCTQGLGCVHVALALRAFKASGGAAEATVGNLVTADPGSKVDALRIAVDATLTRLLDVGVTAGVHAHSQTLDRARREADALNAAQARLAVDALAEQIEAYETRSARYDEMTALALAAELYARTRASDAAAALGIGEPLDTMMKRTRLVSLGARLKQEGSDIRVSILLADSDTGATMMLEKLFSPLPSEQGKLAETLPRRQVVPGLALAGLGRGQVLTSVARRRADGLLTLGGGSAGKTQLMPRDATFAFVPPLAATSVEPIIERYRTRPISLLRPRRRIDDVHVFEIEKVLGQAWSPGSQVWQAAVELRNDGGKLYLERDFDAGAPGALEVLAACLEGKSGKVVQVTGPVRFDGGALVCEPWSLGADRLIVPDLDAVEAGGASPPLSPPPGDTPSIELAHRALAGAVHAGRRARDVIAGGQGARIAENIRSIGLARTGDRFSTWLAADWDDVPAFGSAAVWMATLQECGDS